LTKTFNIDLKAVASCAPAMSTEETRYYLCGVHIFEREGKVIYESTNGHLLIQVQSEIEQDEMDYEGLNLIIPAFLVKQLSSKPLQKGFAVTDNTLIPCFVDNTRINIEMIDGLINFKLIDGAFPDTSKVIPKKASCRNLNFDAIGFSPSYMDKIGKSLKSYTGFSVMSAKFSGDTGQEPILIECSSPSWIAVLMPASV
jgi:DNA polymerase III sliding clamp (beta) subunit (PCNA family)